MTDWADIYNSDIAVDSYVDALTYVRFRDRDKYLLEVINGTHDDKIPAQAIEGLLVEDDFNHTKANGEVTIATQGTALIDTGLPTSNAHCLFYAIHLDLCHENSQFHSKVAAVGYGTASNYAIKVERYDTTNTADAVVKWRAVKVAISST